LPKHGKGERGIESGRGKRGKREGKGE